MQQDMKMVSKHGFIKIPLFNITIRGGLRRADRTQKLVATYYLPSGKKSGKLVLEFAIADKDKDQFIEDESSLRFDGYNEIRYFISHMIESMIMIGKKEGKIRLDNFDYRLRNDLRLIEEAYRKRLG